MNMDTLASWIGLKTNVLFVVFLTQLLLSDSSPLGKETTRTDPNPCSTGWLHYQRFCVTQAKGESDAAVALYCDGFGGVGINGYCITRAHTPEVIGSFENSQDSSDNLRDELWRASGKTGLESSQLVDLINTPEDDDSVIEEVACPKGWKHYGKICVYQPMTMKEQCHLLDAVAFSGLCLKHADMEAIEKRGLKYSRSGKDKRVCCCAHISAKQNGYGCM